MSLNQVNSSGELERVAGGTLYADNPLGTILPFGSATIPTGWLLCDGTAISRTEYSELFAVIGTVFGSGDGSSTFNIPDLRGKVPVGFNTSETEFSALGNIGGEKTHTLVISETPSHSHNLTNIGVTSMYQGGGGDVYNCLVEKSGENFATSLRGGGEAHNNLQPYNTVNYIIKAKMTVVPADFLAKVDEVYGDIIPSDASASNKLVTENSLSGAMFNIYINYRTATQSTSTVKTFTPLYDGRIYLHVDNYTKLSDTNYAFNVEGESTTGTVIINLANDGLGWIPVVAGQTYTMTHGASAGGFYHLFCVYD